MMSFLNVPLSVLIVLLAGGTTTDLFTSTICVFPGAHRQVEPQRHCPTSHVHVSDGAQQAHIVVIVVGVEARVVEDLQCPVACPHRAVCDAHCVHHHQPGGHLKHVVSAATAVLHKLLHRLCQIYKPKLWIDQTFLLGKQYFSVLQKHKQSTKLIKVPFHFLLKTTNTQMWC